MHERLHIVADDLTGALDSAVAFAVRGAQVRLACTPDDLPEALDTQADVVAVATGTRDGTATEAAAAVARVARCLQGRPGVLFKKIDSRLKGHIAAELEALVSREGELLINPAIPRLGRFCVGGQIVGAGVEIPISVAEQIGRDVVISDARRPEDLDAMLPESLASRVYVGAAGLAEALARRCWPIVPSSPSLRLSLPALMAIGSRDPVTLAQVDALRNVPVLPAPNGICRDVLSAPAILIQMTQGQEDVSAKIASAAFADTLARAFDRVHPATLFACGGESASALLARLGIGQLDVVGEVLPGVPVARCTTSNSLTLVTKSGGFGAPDTLVKLVNFVASQ